MDNITQNISLFSIVVDISSILGLLVSIYTLLRTGSIKSSVEDVKRKILFSASARDTIENIKNLRESYYNAIHNKDAYTTKELLSRLKTATEILTRSVPLEHKRKCQILVKQLNKQYNSKIFFDETKFIFCSTNKSELWDTYCKVSELIDVTNNIINENEILS